MLIGSSGGAGCCVILEHAVLSRVLKADVLDRRVCVLRWGGGARESGMFGLFLRALSGCRGACEPRCVCVAVVVVKRECL